MELLRVGRLLGVKLRLHSSEVRHRLCDRRLLHMVLKGVVLTRVLRNPILQSERAVAVVAPLAATPGDGSGRVVRPTPQHGFDTRPWCRRLSLRPRRRGLAFSRGLHQIVFRLLEQSPGAANGDENVYRQGLRGPQMQAGGPCQLGARVDRHAIIHRLTF